MTIEQKRVSSGQTVLFGKFAYIPSSPTAIGAKRSPTWPPHCVKCDVKNGCCRPFLPRLVCSYLEERYNLQISNGALMDQHRPL